ncbi:uncharacterized protein LOC144365468 [Ictidomys tridecemlineatus]
MRGEPPGSRQAPNAGPRTPKNLHFPRHTLCGTVPQSAPTHQLAKLGLGYTTRGGMSRLCPWETGWTTWRPLLPGQRRPCERHQGVTLLPENTTEDTLRKYK